MMPSMTPERKKLIIGYCCGIGATIFWGFHSVIIRVLIGQGLDPFLIGDLRLYIGAAVLSLIMLLWNFSKQKPFPRIHYSSFFWLISVSLGINFLLFHKGLEYTIASDAVLLEAFSPVMVLIIVMLFLPKRIGHLLNHPGLPQKILRIVVIGSIGSSLLLINDQKDMLSSHNLKMIGDGLEFLAMFAWALVLLAMHEYQQREKDSSILAATAQFLLCAAIIITPFASWSQFGSITQSQWMLIAILGILPTAGSYVLWHIASKYLDVFPLITLFNLASIVTVIIESAVLGLTVSWKLLLGGIFVLYAAMQAKIINSKYKILGQEEMPGE